MSGNPPKNSNLDMLEKNKQSLNAVDSSLDILDNMTSAMVKKADTIGNEIKDQTKMIHNINNKMDVTDAKIEKGVKKLQDIEASTSTTISWYIMVILMIFTFVLIFFL